MFLYDAQGKICGHLSPRKTTPEEEANEALMKRPSERTGAPYKPPKKGPEPLELRFGKLKDPIEQAKFEWATEAIRQKHGEKAAENFYQLGIAAGEGKESLTNKFKELFPESPKGESAAPSPPRP